MDEWLVHKNMTKQNKKTLNFTAIDTFTQYILYRSICPLQKFEGVIGFEENLTELFVQVK